MLVYITAALFVKREREKLQLSSENVSVYTLGKGKAGNKQRNPVFITGIHAMEI